MCSSYKTGDNKWLINKVIITHGGDEDYYFCKKCISLQITIQFITFFAQYIITQYNPKHSLFKKILKEKETLTMKKYLLLISKGVAICSFVFAAFNANSACAFIYHQPKLPDKVKKLRKF